MVPALVSLSPAPSGPSSTGWAAWPPRPWLRSRAAAAVLSAAYFRRRRSPSGGYCSSCIAAHVAPITGSSGTCRGVSSRVASAATTEAVQTKVDNREAAPSTRPALRLDRDADDQGIKALTATTPLYYANGLPHIGHAYTTITTDVLARYARLQGADVHFVTGMDEHGEKIAQTAAGKEKKPQELVDDIAGEFTSLWERLCIKPDHFIRTTSAPHKEIVNEFWQRCAENGDIYKKDYEGLYCVGCEAYLDADDMLEGNICKIHQKPCVLRREENYFFRLSKYWEDVRAHIEANPDFILPVSRRAEVLAWLNDDNKRDFSISRASTSWGISVPGDDSQVIYVWFDALLGYMSSLLKPEDTASLETAVAGGFPADVHVIGKDIMRFHAIYWPAMLMSASLPLPKHIVTHGFLTKDGLKMGKSLGNVVEPMPLVEAFGNDAVRFYFAGCLAFGEDGDFSYEVFINRVNAALANELGNMVQRVLSLCRKNMKEVTSIEELLGPADTLTEHPVYRAATSAPAEVASAFEQVNFTKAAAAALSIAASANLYISEVEPWKKLKGDEEEKTRALGELTLMAEALRICAVLLSPVTPELAARILTEFGALPEGGVEALRWADAKWRWTPLAGLVGGGKPTPVFQRIDIEPWKGK